MAASKVAGSKVAGSKVAGAAGMMDKLSNYIIVDIGANLTNKGQYFVYTTGGYSVSLLSVVLLAL